MPWGDDDPVVGGGWGHDDPVVGKARKSPSFIEEVAGSFTGAVDKLKTDAHAAMKAQPRRSGNLFKDALDDHAETARLVGDVINVPLAPIGGAIHNLVVRPSANFLDRIPGKQYAEPTFRDATAIFRGERAVPLRELTRDEVHDRNERDVNKALMALGPGKARAIRPPVAKTNYLAEHVNAFERAGVTPDLATASKGGAASIIANGVAENPVAGLLVRPRLKARVGEVAASAERVAGGYGQAGSRGATGETVQGGVKGFNERFSTRSERLYDEAFAPIEAAEGRFVRSTDDFIAAHKERGLEPPPASPAVVPRETMGALKEMAGRINAPRLNNLITDGRIKSILGALESDGAAVRYNDLRALRTWVRNAQKDDQLRQGIDQASLRRLEGALTQDVYANAERLAGPKALRRLKQTDQFYRLGAQRIHGALQNFVGKSGPIAGESTYDMVLRAASDKGGADAARLMALKKSLQPHEWGDVAATTIDRMGKPTAGTAEQGPFSVSQFVTNYEGLSERGRGLLFGTGAQRRELDNLANVAAMVKRVEKGANASKTGVSAQAVGSVAAGAVVGWPVMVKALGAMAGAGEVVTNPAVVRWAARLGSARSPRVLAATVEQLRIAAKSNAALMPLYQQSLRALEAPRVATSVGATPPSDQEP